MNNAPTPEEKVNRFRKPVIDAWAWNGNKIEKVSVGYRPVMNNFIGWFYSQEAVDELVQTKVEEVLNRIEKANTVDMPFGAPEGVREDPIISYEVQEEISAIRSELTPKS